MFDYRIVGRAVLCGVALASTASADVLPEGKVRVPLELTLEGQTAFADTTFVLLGCGANGGHHVGFAKADGAMRCQPKGAVTVYALTTKNAKPLQDLVAKDIGWAKEMQESTKLLEKTPECGKIEEKTLVDRSKDITHLSVKFALEKSGSGCSLKKVGDTVFHSSAPPAASSAAPSAPPPSASAASSAPPASSLAPASVPAKAGGCSSSGSSSGGWVAMVLGLFVLAKAQNRSRGRSRS